MSQPVNRYKADLREFQFLLFEHLNLEAWLQEHGIEDWGPDEIRMVLDETYRFATSVLGPLNEVGDREGCQLRDGRVTTPTGFKEAWAQLYEAGWKSLDAPAAFGGQGAPSVLAALVEEMLSGANTAFNMYPALADGAAELLAEFATERQCALYAQRMFEGTWGGTMCLTEPHAGSDVGASTTTATKTEDGRYLIKGTKIFISGGDQDLTSNVVHLVLARIEGALPGTKGLSLFIVPRLRVEEDGSLGEDNDVQVSAIEHKMGINGSATCALNFGEDGRCLGELVGTTEHQGMRQMFLMMNHARIAVGIQGLAVASTAYLNALEYAKDRKQGTSMRARKDPAAPKVAIIEHPNVRQMLLEMKSKVEGIRMLILKLAQHRDCARLLAGKNDEEAAYHQGQVDLLVPLVKAYGSDQAFRICEIGIQVFGGAGYLKDWPLEQYARDSKIFSIYEGTNSIQALDLVGRKLGQAGGKHTQQFLGDVAAFVEAQGQHSVLGPSVARLKAAQEAVAAGAMQYLQWSQAGEFERIPLTAGAFLEMMSELAVGWLLLDGARVALQRQESVDRNHPDWNFYAGKKHTAMWYAAHVLPNVASQAAVLAAGDRSALDMPLEAFATV